MIQYEDFSIKIEPQREEIYPVIVLRSPAGEGRSSFRLPFDPDDLGDLLVDLGQAVRGTGQRPVREAAPGATRTRPQQIGDQLFNALFTGPVRSLLDQSLGMIRERQKGLRIKLHIDPEDASLARLASLPWELMYRKETRDFLNLSRYTPILRYLDVQVPYVPLTLEPPLRILIVISNPVDCARLNLEHEHDQIERTWARQENVEVSFLETPTIAALQERLEREPFHALHYMGHGGFDQRSGSGVLLLEDDSQYGIPVDGRTLGVLLRDVPTLRLVFLNACETARVTKQVGLDPFAGVAAATVMAGVPAVVAMQFPISDVAAIRFAGRFYPLIALGEPVDYAVAESRRAIRVAESETMEWATPILFMRAPDGVLFRVAEAHRVQRRRPQPPILDKEVEQRLEQLYIAGLGAFWLEEWDRAFHHFQEIVDERPDYKDAALKLQEAERKWHHNELYSQAQEARQAGNWTLVLTRLEELVAEDPDYKDAAALLELAHRQKRLADLYAQARQLHQAGQWAAVVRVFDQIAALDPDYPDPNDLLPTARQEAAGLERQAELNDLYRRAVLEMDAGRWEQAQQLLTRLLEQEPGYGEADRLLTRVQAQILHLEEEHRRQEQIAALYERATSSAETGQWAQALGVMDEIRALDPTFDDAQGIAARARAEVERQDRLEALYARAQAAHNTQDWPEALAALQALVDEDAAYRNAADLLAEVEVQQELADLYALAQQQHGASEWKAVVETFARIAALESDYADPEGLLPAAERSLAEQQHWAELDDLYTRAVQAMEAGGWAQARPLLAQVREMKPGYRDSERLLAQAEAELEQLEGERQRREQVATLYEQAQSLARARQWRPALAKMHKIHALDAGFADPEGIAARARERVAQEDAEAQRQNELATLYAEAVRLLKAGEYQEALEKWSEVQALDPRYPDRKKVQATARKQLDKLARPPTPRRLPRWAWAAIGGAVLLVLTLVVRLTKVPGVGPATLTSTPVPVAAVTPVDTATPAPRATSTSALVATATPVDTATSIPRATSTTPPETVPPPAPTRTRAATSQAAAPSPTSGIPIRIRIVSSSDWTNVTLLQHGEIEDTKTVKIFGEPDVAHLVEDEMMLSVNQSLKNAKSGKYVGLVQEFTMASLASPRDLIFEFDKGCLGSVLVTVYHLSQDTPLIRGEFKSAGCCPCLAYFVVDTTSSRAVGASTAQEGQVHVDQGMRLLDQGEYEAAITELDQALALGWELAGLYSSRAWACREWHFFEEGCSLDRAIADYTKAIELDRQNPDDWERRAELYIDQGQFEAAVRDCDAAIRLDPDHWWAHITRGLAYEQLGNSTQALADLDRAVELAPQDPNPYFHRGLFFGRLGQWDQQVADMTMVIRHNPGWPDGWANRGYAYGQLGQTDKARSDFQEFMELTQDDPSYQGWRIDVQKWLDANPPGPVFTATPTS